MLHWIPQILAKIRNISRRSFNSFPPFTVLAVCLCLTAAVHYITTNLLKKEEDAQFERKVKSVSLAINTRLEIYRNALLATRGFFVASEKVTRDEFHQFTNNFQLETRYPGIQGIGYTALLDPKKLQTHVLEIRKSGLPKYSVWPDSYHGELSSIIFLEPQNWRNQKALGYNMFSESVRRTAMEKARDSGEPTISGRVTLVQETSENPQPGFLIYVPVYKTNHPVSTIRERRRALQGFVYSPFRAIDLFAQIHHELLNDNPTIFMEIFDGDSEDLKDLLYSSAREQTLKQTLCRQERSIRLFLADHPWTLKIKASPQLEFKIWEYSPWILTGFGLILSCLVYFLFQNARQLNRSLQLDVLHRKTAEEKIRAAQKASEEANQAKSRFLANISHEIRTPLGIILGFTDLSLETNDLSQEILNYLQGIKRNALLLTDIIGDVLDLSKIEANKLEIKLQNISLPGTLQDVLFSLNMIAKDKGIQLILKKNDGVPEYITTDPLKFRQILLNLLGNAIKFTEKGQVTLEVRMISLPHLGSPIELEFLIKDTGIGIAPEFVKNIFQPFSQAPSQTGRVYGGTGLGLVLSKQLAKALGGDVEMIDSRVGQGSTFRFNITGGPFNGLWQGDKISTQEKIPAATVSQQVLEGVRILLAEDSKDNQLLLNRYLAPTGALIEIANDGLEAVQLATQKKFDLILMDIQMPNLDGYEATQKLRQQGYQGKIIALTAHAFEEERQRILTGGFDQYLTKPISKVNLIKEILAAIAKK